MSITQIGNLVKQFNDSPSNKIIQNAITMNDLRTLAVNWSATKTSDETVFSEELPKISITDQKSSGRCWLFAALNVLRRYVIADFNLPADFELSQSYVKKHLLIENLIKEI
jgi:bleomycin hydrolase